MENHKNERALPAEELSPNERADTTDTTERSGVRVRHRHDHELDAGAGAPSVHGSSPGPGPGPGPGDVQHVGRPGAHASAKPERPDRQEKREETPTSHQETAKPSTKTRARGRAEKSSLERLRVERMMSKAELARRAGVSTLTIDRVERGLSCRMDTKRKILEALGLKPSDRDKVFGKESEGDGRGADAESRRPEPAEPPGAKEGS